MLVLSYLMWSQHWCLTDLRDIDRQARKIVCENGGKHPLRLKATDYQPRAQGGRGMRSVEEEYKMTKIKSAIKLYSNMTTPPWAWYGRLKKMRHIKAISRSSKRLESLQRNWGAPLTEFSALQVP